MLIFQIIFLLLNLIALIWGVIYLKNCTGFNKEKIYKIFSITLAIIFFFRYMLGHDYLGNTISLSNSEFDSKFFTFISLIGNWILIASNLLIILYPFFISKKYSVLIKFFCLPVSIFSIIFIQPLTKGIIGNIGFETFDIRAFLLVLEISISLFLSLDVFLDNDGFKCEKKDLKVLVLLIGILPATMPIYVLQGLFGYNQIAHELSGFSQEHRVILYLAFLIPLSVYIILRNKSEEVKKLCLLYISLGTLITFCVNYRFADFLDVTAWPFHLCHTAMFIIPICLIFKLNKLFYFTYFINVLGAFLAMTMPSYDHAQEIFHSSIINFYVNHYIAFFMPILIVMLGIYKRPKLREFKYSMVGFGIYFSLVLVLNAWFSNYGSVDYFYINGDFIVDKLGLWAEKTKELIWQFRIGELKFVFYPVYQIIFFVVYVLMGAGVWFVYEWIYIFEDSVLDIIERNIKIKVDTLALSVALSKRERSKPVNKEGKNKLIIRDFSKRYGSSENYAVRNANLEINGGEIFGFLGHNGAGKSTIIKSIVGIQPITSGNIEVCGFDVEMQAVEAKKNIGFVPDHYALYEKLTGREYVNYIADLYDISKEDRNKCIDKFIKLFELSEAFDNQIKTYSHGMKQKITIISALVHNPKVWILDEPLTGLDPTSIYQVKQCMKEHAKKGNIVFFSSHLIDVVESICDKVAIIKKGKILTIQSLKDIEKHTSLERFYLDVSKKSVDRIGDKVLDTPNLSQYTRTSLKGD